MLTKKTNQEDEFYQDLDKKNLQGSCCTCKSLAIFFIILAIVTGLTVLYLLRQIKQINVSFERVKPETNSVTDLDNKLNITSETFTISITSDELTNLVKLIKATGLSVEDIQAKIHPENIEFLGKLTKPLKADLQILAVPEISDGKLYLKVTKITAGKLVLPNLVNHQIESNLNKILDEKFAKLYENYRIEQIFLEDDKMNISGKLKKEN